METPKKKPLFKGSKKEIEEQFAALEQQAADAEREAERLRQEIRSLEANNETLAMENSRLADERRILREERDRAAARAAGLEQELEEARRRTSDGQAAVRTSCDPYLSAVGEVYKVACHSAGSLVEKARDQSLQLVDTLQGQSLRAREEAETVLTEMRALRDALGNQLPDLIGQLEQTYEKVDRFLQHAETVPETYRAVGYQEEALHAMQEELDRFDQETSRTVGRIFQEPETAAAPPAGTSEAVSEEAEPISGAVAADTVDAGKNPPAENAGVSAAGETTAEAETAGTAGTEEAAASEQESTAEDFSAVPTLLEQEKQRRRDASPSVPMPEPCPAPSSVTPSIPDVPRRRANVKDLLDKYSQLK